MKKIIGMSLVGIMFAQSAFAFTDLSSTHWAYENVMNMKENKIISGFDDDTFRPDNFLTREEFATMLAKGLNLTENIASGFIDSKGRWSSNYINNVGRCLVDDGEFMFLPESYALREDVAMGLVKIKALEDSIYSEDTLKQFCDFASISENRRKYVAIAVEEGLMQGNSNGTFSPKCALTRAEGASVIANLLDSFNEKSKLYTYYKLTDFIYDRIFDFSEGLARVKKNGKFGYINENGKEVIACIYDDCSGLGETEGSFSEGLAVICKDRKYGYINKEGKEVIPCIYDSACDFSEGLAFVETNYGWGVINKSGNMVIKPQYNNYWTTSLMFSEGLARVNIYEKFGYIDKNGNEIVPFLYERAYNFSDGLAVVVRDEKYGIIDKNGKEIVACIYDRISNFSDGLAVVVRDEKYGIIDKNGKEIVACIYDYISNFSDGLVVVVRDEKYGIIDKNGKEIVACIYDDIIDLEDGKYIVKETKTTYIGRDGKQIVDLQDKIGDKSNYLTRVKKDGKYGYVNNNGEEKIPCIYEDIYFSDSDGEYAWFLVEDYNNRYMGYVDKNGNEITEPYIYKYGQDDSISYGFSEGLAIVRQSYDYGYVNTDGELVIPCIYDEAYKFHDGIAWVCKDGKYGCIDKEGNEVIPFIYEAQYSGRPRGGNAYYRFWEGLAFVKKDGKYGYIDKEGNEVIPFIYDEAGAFSEGLAFVKKDGKYGYIDKEGNEVIPFIYDEVRVFSEGIALVGKGEYDSRSFGYIDKNGNEIVPCIYDKTYDFLDGFGIICKNEKYGSVNKDGKVVVPCVYDYDTNSEVLCEKNSLYYMVNKSGEKEKLEIYDYDYIEDFAEDFAVVIKNGKYGYIDKEGNEVIPCTFDRANKFSNGIAHVYRFGKSIWIDKEGKEIALNRNSSSYFGGKTIVEYEDGKVGLAKIE